MVAIKEASFDATHLKVLTVENLLDQLGKLDNCLFSLQNGYIFLCIHFLWFKKGSKLFFILLRFHVFVPGGFSWFQLWAAVITICPEIPAAMVSLSPVLTGSHQFCDNTSSPFYTVDGCEKTESFPGVLKSVVQEVSKKTFPFLFSRQKNKSSFNLYFSKLF